MLRAIVRMLRAIVWMLRAIADEGGRCRFEMFAMELPEDGTIQTLCSFRISCRFLCVCDVRQLGSYKECHMWERFNMVDIVLQGRSNTHHRIHHEQGACWLVQHGSLVELQLPFQIKRGNRKCKTFSVTLGRSPPTSVLVVDEEATPCRVMEELNLDVKMGTEGRSR
eukprot:9481143-Pyramimonas_sp.AAC.4